MPEAPDPDDAPVAWARCIVRDLTGAHGGATSRMTIDLAGSAKVASLVDEVAKQTNSAPDKFVISLQQCAGGEEVRPTAPGGDGEGGGATMGTTKSGFEAAVWGWECLSLHAESMAQPPAMGTRVALKKISDFSFFIYFFFCFVGF